MNDKKLTEEQIATITDYMRGEKGVLPPEGEIERVLNLYQEALTKALAAGFGRDKADAAIEYPPMATVELLVQTEAQIKELKQEFERAIAELRQIEILLKATAHGAIAAINARALAEGEKRKSPSIFVKGGCVIRSKTVSVSTDWSEEEAIEFIRENGPNAVAPNDLGKKCIEQMPETPVWASFKNGVKLTVRTNGAKPEIIPEAEPEVKERQISEHLGDDD